MKLSVDPFRASDIAMLPHSPVLGTEADLSLVEAQGMSFTGRVGDGVVCCGGLVRMYEGRALAWCSFANPFPSGVFLPVHRAVSGVLDRHRFRRVEMTVESDFRAGRRWARLLGFSPEGWLSCYGIDGKNHIMFARINHG